MAYNPYTGNYYNAWERPYQVGTQPQQIQNGGFISVRSAQDAMNYPVAPGNSVTFKDESGPYVYVKTMGFNQMEAPSFKRYRLGEEDLNTMPTVAEKQPASFVSQQEFEDLKAQVMMLRKSVDLFTDKEVAKDE